MTNEETKIIALKSYKQACIDIVKIINDMLQKTIVTYDQLIAVEEAKNEGV